MCPKCQSLTVSEITDMDDKMRVFFCGNCSLQGGEIDFLPESDETEADEQKPSLLKRFINKFRS